MHPDAQLWAYIKIKENSYVDYYRFCMLPCRRKSGCKNSILRKLINVTEMKNNLENKNLENEKVRAR